MQVYRAAWRRTDLRSGDYLSGGDRVRSCNSTAQSRGSADDCGGADELQDRLQDCHRVGKGTYYAIGNDLAKFVAPDANIQLEVLPTAGSAANVKLLRFEPGVKFAVVQADVFQAFLDREGANAEARRIIRPLRVILPLYNTEIHYIVRADSPMNYLHDIKDAKINGGLVGSGAAFITHTLYRMNFDKPIPEANASFLSNEEALTKLITDKSVDVVVVRRGYSRPPWSST